MTIKQVHSAEAIHRARETFYRIRVWEHRRSCSASIIVPIHMFSMLSSYIENTRDGAEEEDLVFVSSYGKPISKAARDELNHLAQALGEEKPLTSKLATETAVNAKPEDGNTTKVRTHMTHNVSTAESVSLNIVTLFSLSVQTKRPLEEEKENSPPPKRVKRLAFTEEQEKAILDYFNVEEKVHLKDARRFLDNNKELFEGRSEKMIQDKCSNLRKRKFRNTS